MATIDGRYVTVESEDPSYEVETPEQPVEKGVNLIDHVERKARTMSISGLIVGDDAAQIRQYLIDAQDIGSIVTYDGRNSFVGLITGFKSGHTNQVANGCTFSLTFKEVRIAESSFVETLPLPIRAQAAPVISSGRKQKKEKSEAKKKTTKSKAKGKEKKKDKPVEKVTFKPGSPWA
ncbi:phage baseplate protein [Paenibacillus sp. RC84]|uniref:phage baseplate protein n=1 Tax=Paenibacillus sp. RC84 TaxID=3156252 RepID=UPI00351236BE